MATFPFFISQVHGSFQFDPPKHWCNGWFKPMGAPPTDTTIVDINMGPAGYLRLKLTAALHVIEECSYGGIETHHDITGTVDVAHPITGLGIWYWYSILIGRWDNAIGGNPQPLELIGGLWNIFGVSQGSCATNFGSFGMTEGAGYSSYDSVLGVGVSRSSGYANNPVDGSVMYLTKPEIYQTTANFTGPMAPPAGDRAPGSTPLFYACRETVGDVAAHTAGALHNTGSDVAFDLEAGPVGMRFVLDGPYTV
jgi:hypothetical protein